MKRVLLLSAIMLGTQINSQVNLKALPHPYNSLQKLLDLKLEGWFQPTNAIFLRKFIKQTNAKIIVELGSWLGLSATFMAKESQSNAKLYAVDTWLGSVPLFQHPPSVALIPTLYEQFLSNVIHLNLVNKIIPVRMPSNQAARFLNIRPDVVYVDASHEEEDVYNDIMLWYPKLNTKGIICGDDWLVFPSVKTAVNRAAKILKLRVYDIHNFWYFEPKS